MIVPTEMPALFLCMTDSFVSDTQGLYPKSNAHEFLLARDVRIALFIVIFASEIPTDYE